MTEFTPLQSLAGGALIGTATVLLMALHGRVAGITGILSGVLPPGMAADWGWRLAFLAGMIGSPVLYSVATGASIPFQTTASLATLLVGGAIVGIGVTFGSGCTSGHGICGLARFSPRSAVAVITFMASAAMTVFVTRHMMGG